MEPEPRLSPQQFKEMYKNPMIAAIKLFRRGAKGWPPVTYAEITDVTGDVMLYRHDPGISAWSLRRYTA